MKFRIMMNFYMPSFLFFSFHPFGAKQHVQVCCDDLCMYRCVSAYIGIHYSKRIVLATDFITVEIKAHLV